MKRTVCILLSCLLALTGLVGLGMTTNAIYKVGSTYTFGSYPQTEVTASLGSTLNDLSGAWTSYNYGTVNGNDCMQYKDVTYNGAKYRGVSITENRPIGGSYSNTQRDNGYIKGTVYWFKWEPLQWRVLDPSAGFILCESIVDSQPFQSDLNSDYANSNIRTWLNQTFLNTAFSSDEKAAIQTTTLDNTSALSPQYDSSTTNDKVFLLSYAEATNSAYGFRSEDFYTTDTDFNRLKEGSDYAKCQGLWYCYDAYSLFENFSYWWLRTPYSPFYACGVEYDSRVFTNELVTHTNYGVCPAIKIGDLNSGITVKSIAVKNKPSKTTYNIGESFDQTGLTLTVTYSDYSTDTVTSGFTCTGFSSATAGAKTITVTYEGKTTTFTVTVNPVLTGIAVKTMPAKTTYNIGDSFSQTGLTLTATYSDGSTQTVTSGFTCSGFSSASAGTKTITVTYKGKTTTFTVTVNAVLTGISVKTMPAKFSYFVGESFDQTGLTLTAIYSDSSTKTVTSGFTCSGFSSAAPGISTVTVQYEGKTATFDVTINPASVSLTGIAVKTLPGKTVYTIGESFDQTGLTLALQYSDGSTGTVTEGFACSGFSSATAGTKTVTVTYKGFITTFDVTINPASVSLTGIAVKTMPAKTVYAIGESFDQTGLTLTLQYSDGSTGTVTEGFACTGFSSATAGTKTITVTYKGLNTTFSVTVKSASAVLTDITVKTMPKKTVYTYRNDKNLDLTGLEVEAKYSDGSTKPVDPSACKITGYSAKPAGDKTITVEYEGQTAQFKVTVKYAWWQQLIRIFLLGFIWY